MCAENVLEEWLVPLIPLSSMTGDPGSANQEWGGEQLPGMEGGALHSGLPG